MAKIVFVTLYDSYCLGVRLLSAIAKARGVETRLVFFKEHRTRPSRRSSENQQLYQLYHDGVKHATLYAAYPYTRREIRLFNERLRREAPDAIFLSARSFALPYARELLAPLRRELGVPLVAGGWGPALEPERFLDFCDYVCFGEGERATAAICDHLLAGSRDFSDVPNLIHRNAEGIQRNPVIPPLTDVEIDALPQVDFDLDRDLVIDDDVARSGRQALNSGVYTCLATRGCPMDCSYCMAGRYQAIYRQSGHALRRFRIRGVDSVLAELEVAKRRGARFIRFKDEVFPSQKKWLKEFLPRYQREIGLPFFGYLRPELHSLPVVEAAIDAGLVNTHLGIQSGSPRIRKEIYNRPFAEEVVLEFARYVRRRGVDVTYHLIHHNPFESEADMDATLDLMCRLPYGKLYVMRLVTFPGAPITAMIEAQRPVGLPEETHEWYAHLWMLAAEGPSQRALAKRVHSLGLFRRRPALLRWPLLPARLKLKARQVRNKLLFGQATVLSLPLRRDPTGAPALDDGHHA